MAKKGETNLADKSKIKQPRYPKALWPSAHLRSAMKMGSSENRPMVSGGYCYQVTLLVGILLPDKYGEGEVHGKTRGKCMKRQGGRSLKDKGEVHGKTRGNEEPDAHGERRGSGEREVFIEESQGCQGFLDLADRK